MKPYVLGTAALLVAATLAGAAVAQGGREPADFSTLDVSGDGLLTVEDFETRRAERFAAMDANGDGGIDQAEFSAMLADRASDRATRMFERLDADGDGIVSRDALEARGDRGGARFERMIERFDADGNGGLSAEEFETARAEMRDRFGDRDRVRK